MVVTQVCPGPCLPTGSDPHPFPLTRPPTPSTSLVLGFSRWDAQNSIFRFSVVQLEHLFVSFFVESELFSFHPNGCALTIVTIYRNCLFTASYNIWLVTNVKKESLLCYHICHWVMEYIHICQRAPENLCAYTAWKCREECGCMCVKDLACQCSVVARGKVWATHSSPSPSLPLPPRLPLSPATTTIGNSRSLLC